MNTKVFHKVYSVNGRLQAALVQTMLENAGIPATITASPSGNYQDVLVPEIFAYQAKNIFNPGPRPSEFLADRVL